MLGLSQVYLRPQQCNVFKMLHNFQTGGSYVLIFFFFIPSAFVKHFAMNSVSVHVEILFLAARHSKLLEFGSIL